ncbi:MAG: hypothetical protein JXO48_03105 [Deltaproteobacteria bacterium]|nr:hypothetical protein [Deltaproteobacteria bacterium]
MKLRRYNISKQTVEFRRPNFGKAITDNLATISVDPDVLDMASETQPLLELIRPMAKFHLVTKVEIPKLARRGKLIEYGWGVIRSLVMMNVMQHPGMNPVSRNRQSNLTDLKKEIAEYARERGYICGFTKIDRRFIAEGDDRLFPYDTALVLGMEMDRELLDEVPSPGKRLFDFEIYVRSGRLVFDVARFIRSRGYRCFVRAPFDGGVKYPPHAVMAGLGELGANGVVITREFGPRVRWCMISINADIELDEPVNLNMADFCDDCRLCIRACPGGAIPEERFWWRGVNKRKINDSRCYPFFIKYEGCGLCLKVCPIHRFGYDACMEWYMKDGIVLGKRA